MANEKAKFRRNGDKLDYGVTSTALACGDLVVVGGIVGVAEAGGAVGEPVTLTVSGVFEFTAADAVTQGADVYVGTGGKLTATKPSSGAVLVGKAWTAASGADERFYVKLNA